MPKAPPLRRREGKLEWDVDAGSRWFVVQVRSASGWRTTQVLGGTVRSCALPADAIEAVVTAVGGNGALTRSAVLQNR